MRRLIVCFLLLAGIAGFVVLPAAYSQDGFDYSRAYQDYIYNLGLYRKVHADYELARNQYLQSQTLVSKAKAQEATVRMFQARDEVVKTYLTALRMRLAEAQGVSDYQEESLNAQIDDEFAFYKDHKESIPSAATLEDLVKDSDKVSQRWKSTEVLVYTILTTISSGKVSAFQDTLSGIISSIQTKVAEIRQAGDKETKVLERWILEMQNRLTRSQEKEYEAQKLLVEIEPREKKKGSIYNEIVFKLEESRQYLKEANSFGAQIIDEVKVED